MPGKPLVYSTSKTFMDYFGINSAIDLPKLKEVFAETLVEPTIIAHDESAMATYDDPTTFTHVEPTTITHDEPNPPQDTETDPQN